MAIKMSLSFRTTTVNLVKGIILILFVYSSVFKLLNFSAYQGYVSTLLSEKDDIARSLMFSIPVVELIVAGLLIYHTTGIWGLYTALVSFTFFSLLNIYLFNIKGVCRCRSTEGDTTWEQNNILTTSCMLLCLLAIILSCNKKFGLLVTDKNKPGLR